MRNKPIGGGRWASWEEIRAMERGEPAPAGGWGTADPPPFEFKSVPHEGCEASVCIEVDAGDPAQRDCPKRIDPEVRERALEGGEG
jgi:hypothetical protein